MYEIQSKNKIVAFVDFLIYCIYDDNHDLCQALNNNCGRQNINRYNVLLTNVQILSVNAVSV